MNDFEKLIEKFKTDNTGLVLFHSDIERLKAAYEAGKGAEKVCEWVDCHDDTYITCSGLPADGKGNYCPNCGGKVVIKKRMCELAGIEFPIPEIRQTRETEYSENIAGKWINFEDQDALNDFRKAISHTLKLAIEEAK